MYVFSIMVQSLQKIVHVAKMENQTILNMVFGVAMIIIGTFAYLGLQPGDEGFIEANYYCEDREVKTYCEGFSKYYSLPNGKCLSPNGNKLCRSGWEEIPVVISISSKGDYLCHSTPRTCEVI